MIKLQAFTEHDFAQLISWVSSPEFLLKWAGPNFTYPLTHEQLYEYIKGANQNNSNMLVYKVIEHSTNTTIGHIALKNIDLENNSARVGKVLVGDHARGQGFGLLMMEEILKVAFQDMKLHKVTLGVFDFNEPAVKTYKKVGFQVDGLLRDHRKFDKEYWNLIEMSILCSEWHDHLKLKKDSSKS
ncbi:GNAT family N-acetyltransferase [Halobacillus seohaensis]|uniref:GNAT family N-acetyltransferase n=1 Tax=Halobacillus seohaensis TaxID=447421 RepID=A0ABW2EI27_9BACI